MIPGVNYSCHVSRPNGGGSVWICFPVQSLQNAATTRIKKVRRANSRLTQTVPAPEYRNDTSLSSVEHGDRRNSDEAIVTKKCRIQWTQSLDADLLRCSENVQLPRGAGQGKELLSLWQKSHPELPSTVTALAQRLSRIRKMGTSSSIAAETGEETLVDSQLNSEGEDPSRRNPQDLDQAKGGLFQQRPLN